MVWVVLENHGPASVCRKRSGTRLIVGLQVRKRHQLLGAHPPVSAELHSADVRESPGIADSGRAKRHRSIIDNIFSQSEPLAHTAQSMPE